jgi:hypothetical protein
MTMPRSIALMSLMPLLLLATPAAAVTDKEKMETCKVGADSQGLKGAKREIFVKRCMAKGNYVPPARKNANPSTAAPKQQ